MIPGRPDVCVSVCLCRLMLCVVVGFMCEDVKVLGFAAGMHSQFSVPVPGRYTEFNIPIDIDVVIVIDIDALRQQQIQSEKYKCLLLIIPLSPQLQSQSQLIQSIRKKAFQFKNGI
jgi:hypothetical protein